MSPMLSAREIDVVRRIASGLKYQEIADELALSFETVKTYAARIRRKLGMRSKTEVAIWAVRRGMEMREGENPA